MTPFLRTVFAIGLLFGAASLPAASADGVNWYPYDGESFTSGVIVTVETPVKDLAFYVPRFQNQPMIGYVDSEGNRGIVGVAFPSANPDEVCLFAVFDPAGDPAQTTYYCAIVGPDVLTNGACAWVGVEKGEAYAVGTEMVAERTPCVTVDVDQVDEVIPCVVATLSGTGTALDNAYTAGVCS